MFGLVLLMLLLHKCSSSLNKICFYREDEGSGNHPLEKYYYNATIGECMTFTYYGDGGNDNNFFAKDVCEQTCNSSGIFDRRNCQKPHSRGFCFEHTYNFYYDPESKRCENFAWLECGTNENNFKSYEECEAKCGSAYVFFIYFYH
uniref:BPTI/Kunitz inhibitor domain-containing protein n=1 Tax=Trichobilharzia regenti TaxID=157069 RepID=A0AA85K5L9_TRIRE|nr:unnamed protein product [Trichobilharzia regenti]